MELSLRLLHLPVDGPPVTRERGRRARDRHGWPHDSARILIVGDEPAAAEAVRDHLLERGHTVDLAFSTDEALTAIRQIRRDVVFLDISMPLIDGGEALRRIRTVDATLPVIVVTGNADRSFERETSKVEACGFADLDRATAVALTSRRVKSGGHRDIDGPLCHAPGHQLRAKRPDAGPAGLA